MAKASDNEFPSVLFDEQGSDPATPGAGLWRLYPKAAGFYAIDDAGAVTGPFGTGGGGGGLLAVVKNTSGGTPSTTSAAQADVDATNAAITFTAPASGNVLVRVTATGNLPASNVNAFLGLREGTTNLVNGTTGTQAMQSQTSDSGGDVVFSWTAYLTGLSAGSHTYKVAFAVNGGVTFTLRASATSPMTIEVWEAP